MAREQGSKIPKKPSLLLNSFSELRKVAAPWQHTQSAQNSKHHAKKNLS